MGQDKAALRTADGSTILERLIGRLSPLVDVVIVAGPRQAGLAADYSDRSLLYVSDRTPKAGPLAGLEAGMRAAGERVIWVVACDQPDVLPEVGQKLFTELGNYDAVVPLIAGKPQPLCAVYAPGLADRASALLMTGTRSMMDFLASLRIRYLRERDLREVDRELRSFVNLNTQSDYEAWFEKELASSEGRQPV